MNYEFKLRQGESSWRRVIFYHRYLKRDKSRSSKSSSSSSAPIHKSRSMEKNSGVAAIYNRARAVESDIFVPNHRRPNPISMGSLDRRGFSRYRNADSYILTKLRYDHLSPFKQGINSIGELLSSRASRSSARVTPKAFTFTRERCIYAGEIMSLEFNNIRICYFDANTRCISKFGNRNFMTMCMCICQKGVIINIWSLINMG